MSGAPDALVDFRTDFDGELSFAAAASFLALFFCLAAWAAAADILLAGYGPGAASRGAALAGYWLRCWVLPRGSRRAASLLFPAQTDDE